MNPEITTYRYLEIELNQSAKFLDVVAFEGAAPHIITYNEQQCDNSISHHRKQILLFSHLIFCLRQEAAQEVQFEASIFFDHADCCQSPEEGSAKTAALQDCPCAKTQVIMQKIFNQYTAAEELSDRQAACLSLAEALEWHLKHNLSIELEQRINKSQSLHASPSQAQKDGNQRPLSKSLGAIDYCKSKFKANFTSEALTPKTKAAKPKPPGSPSTKIAKLSDAGIEFWRFKATKMYAHHLSEKEIRKYFEYKELKDKCLPEDLKLLSEDNLEGSLLRQLTQEKLHRTFLHITQNPSPFTVSQDIDRLLNYLTISDPEGSIAPPPQDESDVEARLRHFQSILLFFCKQLESIEQLLSQLKPPEKAKIAPLHFLKDDFWKAEDLEQADDATFADCCEKFIRHLVEKGRDEQDADNQHTLALSYFLSSLAQEAYTLPACCILDLFAPETLEVQKKSLQIDCHFLNGVAQLRAKVSLVPSAKLMAACKTQGCSPFVLNVINVQRASIMNLSSWSSRIDVELLGDQAAIPPFILERLRSCRFLP